MFVLKDPKILFYWHLLVECTCHIIIRVYTSSTSTSMQKWTTYQQNKTFDRCYSSIAPTEGRREPALPVHEHIMPQVCFCIGSFWPFSNRSLLRYTNICTSKSLKTSKNIFRSHTRRGCLFMLLNLTDLWERTCIYMGTLSWVLGVENSCLTGLNRCLRVLKEQVWLMIQQKIPSVDS